MVKGDRTAKGTSRIDLELMSSLLGNSAFMALTEKTHGMLSHQSHGQSAMRNGRQKGEELQ